MPFYLIKAFELSKEDYLLPFPDVNSNSLERILNFMNSNSLDSVDYQAKSLERFLQRYDTKKLEDVKKIIELYEKYVKSREVGNLLKSSLGTFFLQRSIIQKNQKLSSKYCKKLAWVQKNQKLSTS